MIRIAICDDEIISLELLYQMVADYLKLNAHEEYLVRRFHSPYDLLECLENPNLHFDIYFLDVVMPVFSGIDIARTIRKNDEFAPIIFTTASAEYALSATETSPHQYLVKPINREKLYQSLDSAIRKAMQTRDRSMLVKRKDGLANIGLHHIEYVEYRDHALTFFLSDGRAVESRVMKESFAWIVEHVLKDSRFIKPHESFAVNMDHVASMDSREFVMESGALVPISKRVFSHVKQQFILYKTQYADAMII